MQHTPQHEEILALFLGGEVSAEDPQVAQLLEHCEVCAHEVEELREMSRVLDRAAAPGREAVLAEASAADQDQVADMFDEVWADEPRRRFRLLQPLLAAAALLLLAGGASFFLWGGGGGTGGSGSGSDPGQWLGNKSDELLIAPLGKVSAAEGFREFTWEQAPERGGTITLEVWNAGVTEAAVIVPGIRTKSYTLEPLEEERLGDAIRWRISYEDGLADGESYEGYALLSQ